jgi:hypothetical protein
MTVEERLERLERENRMLKIMLLSIFLFLGIVFILGTKGGKEIEADVVKARAVVVVDLNGKPRIRLDSFFENPELLFLNEYGKITAAWNGFKLALYQEPMSSVQYDEKVVEGILFDSIFPSLTLHTTYGRKVRLNAHFCDLDITSGKANISLGFGLWRNPHLWLWEETGEGVALGGEMIRIKERQPKEGPFLSFWDREHEEKGALGIEKGNGYLVLYDRSGNTKVSF